MTDEQIMQGLKWCYQVEGSCGDCPYRPDEIKKAKCHDRLGNDVIGLIERQQAEIDRLEAEVDTYVTLAKDMHDKAIKRFADKLKDKFGYCVAMDGDCEIYSTKSYSIMAYEFDGLINEMVGVDNE